MSAICKYCGKEDNVGTLTGTRCSKSPTGKHIPYEGDMVVRKSGCDPTFIKRTEFVCKYCGYKAKTISSLTSSRCSKNTDDGGSGTKYHVPLQDKKSNKINLNKYF